jgi:hypothetical protein
MAIGLRLALTGVVAWYLAFFCEHVTHYLVHAPRAARWPLWSFLRALHMRHHRRYAGSTLLQPGPYESHGGAWLVLPSLPLVAALWWALPCDLFVLGMCESALLLFASNHLHSQFHTEGSWLERSSWFLRRRRYHFEHHRHPRTNMSLGGVELAFDKAHGTWRRDPGP